MPSFRAVLLTSFALAFAASSVMAAPTVDSRIVRVRRRVDGLDGGNEASNKNPLHVGIGWVRAQRDMMESDEDAVEDFTQSEVVALVDLEHEVPADEIKAMPYAAEPEESAAPASNEDVPSTQQEVIHPSASFWNISRAPLSRLDSTPGDALKVAKEIKRLGALQMQQEAGAMPIDVPTV